MYRMCERKKNQGCILVFGLINWMSVGTIYWSVSFPHFVPQVSRTCLKNGGCLIKICLMSEWGRLGGGNMYIDTTLSMSISLLTSVSLSVFESRSSSVSIFWDVGESTFWFYPF